MCSKIKIHYQFHPHFGEELEIFSKPRKQFGTFTVIDRKEKTLKIPYWMTEEKSAKYKIEKSAIIKIEALLKLPSLVDFHLNNIER